MDGRAACSQRQGAVLITVLVVLSIALAICGSLLRASLAERRLVQWQVWQAQADSLAEAAIERAAARLAAESAYAGETWELPAEDLDGRHAGAVVIEVVALSDEMGRLEIKVRADFPSGLDLPARATRRVLLSEILDSE